MILRQHGLEGLAKTRSAEDGARNNALKSTKLKLVGDNMFGLSEWYPKIRKAKEDTTEEKKAENDKPKRGRPPKKVKEESTGAAQEPKTT